VPPNPGPEAIDLYIARFPQDMSSIEPGILMGSYDECAGLMGMAPVTLPGPDDPPRLHGTPRRCGGLVDSARLGLRKEGDDKNPDRKA
jgi:hypothetical protein